MKNISSSRIFFISLIVSATLSLRAQKDPVDSMKTLLKNAAHDTTRLNILLAIAEIAGPEDLQACNKQCHEIIDKNFGKGDAKTNKLFTNYLGLTIGNDGVLLAQNGDYEKSAEKLREALVVMQQTNNKKGIAGLNLNLSQVYQALGKFKEEIICLNNCLAAYTDLKDTTQIALTYRLLGKGMKLSGDVMSSIDVLKKSVALYQTLPPGTDLVETYRILSHAYEDIGDMVRATDNLSNSIALAERLHNDEECSISYNDLAYLLSKQDEAELAMGYYKKSLKISEAGKRLGQQATTLNNIGLLYKAEKKYSEALEYFNRSLSIYTKKNNKYGMSIGMHNVSLIYTITKDFPTALKYAGQALRLTEEINAVQSIPAILNQLGALHMRMKQDALAETYLKRALEKAKALGSPEFICAAAINLKTLYENKNPSESLHMYELYIEMRDSINNDATKKAASHARLKYEFDMKTVADSLKTAKRKK